MNTIVGPGGQMLERACTPLLAIAAVVLLGACDSATDPEPGERGTAVRLAGPGLIAHYPLDGNASDVSGFNKHGTVIGASATADRFGVPNSALFFDGINDYVRTPQGSNFKPLAFSVWFRADDVSRERSIVDSDVAGRFGHSLIIGYLHVVRTPTCPNPPWCRFGDGSLDVQFHNGAHDTAVPIAQGRWYHAVVNYSSTVEVYLNGARILSQSYPGAFFDGTSFRFGRHNSIDPQWFKGAIDDVRFFDQTLTRQEVLQLFHPIVPVDIDIKPGSNPNSINCENEGGVIPVAILTTGGFDATTVDHATVAFEGAGETHVNKKSGDPRRHEEDADDDGDTDLVLHFRTGDTNLTCSSTEGTLTGETFDGQEIEGSDAVRMIGG